VRGRGVDDPHLAFRIDQRHRLTRRIVGQAQDSEVGVVERLAPGCGILAARLVERHQRKLGPSGKPIGDLESGRPGGAVDEDRVYHQSSASSRSRWT
jgi:hypothetical protein